MSLTENEILKTMAAHASVRKYKEDDIPDDLLAQILTAARQAPTSSNLQAYSIIVIKDQNKKKKLAYLSGNQIWIEKCPVFLAICPDLHRLGLICKYRSYEIKDEYIELLITAIVDSALVAQNILLAAQSCGLGGVMIGGVRNNPYEIWRLLELPKKVFVLMGICLGWPDTKPMKKPRLPEEVVIHKEHYKHDDISRHLLAYDQMVRSTGLYNGPGRKMPPIDNREIPDDEYSWTEHSARRLASTEPSLLRPHMRKFLEDIGFELK